MKWSEVRKIAEKRGWFLVKHGANHDLYKHESKEGILLIGRHQSKEVAEGTLNKIRKQVGF